MPLNAPPMWRQCLTERTFGTVCLAATGNKWGSDSVPCPPPGVQRSICCQRQWQGLYVAFSDSGRRDGGGRSFPKIDAALVQSLRSGARIKLSVSHLISAGSSLYDPCVVGFHGIRAQGSMSVGRLVFCFSHGLNRRCGDLNSTESSA